MSRQCRARVGHESPGKHESLGNHASLVGHREDRHGAERREQPRRAHLARLRRAAQDAVVQTFISSTTNNNDERPAARRAVCGARAAARTPTARSSAWRRTHQRRWVTTSSRRSGPAARSSACCPRAARTASRAAYSAHLLRALLPSGLSSLCSPDAPPLAPCEKSLSGPRRAMRHADEAAPSLSAWLGVPPDKSQYRCAAERPSQLPPPPPQPPRRGRAASALLAPHPSALRWRLALGLAGLHHSRQV